MLNRQRYTHTHTQRERERERGTHTHTHTHTVYIHTHTHTLYTRFGFDVIININKLVTPNTLDSKLPSTDKFY